jgi:hypothetical protein
MLPAHPAFLTANARYSCKFCKWIYVKLQNMQEAPAKYCRKSAGTENCKENCFRR